MWSKLSCLSSQELLFYSSITFTALLRTSPKLHLRVKSNVEGRAQKQAWQCWGAEALRASITMFDRSKHLTPGTALCRGKWAPGLGGQPWPTWPGHWGSVPLLQKHPVFSSAPFLTEEKDWIKWLRSLLAPQINSSEIITSFRPVLTPGNLDYISHFRSLFLFLPFIHQKEASLFKVCPRGVLLPLKMFNFVVKSYPPQESY